MGDLPSGPGKGGMSGLLGQPQWFVGGSEEDTEVKVLKPPTLPAAVPLQPHPG